MPLFLFLVFPFLTSCAYLHNRGNDALDVFDVGVTITEEPRVSVYAGFMNLMSLGYANLDQGTLIGIGSREIGAIPMRQNASGIIVYGREQFAFGSNCNPEDPDSPEPWAAGILALPEGPAPPPKKILYSPKVLHLGWLGLTLNCKIGEFADFVLGWATVDFMDDDTSE